jgi:uracil-DNA glycosylase
MSSVRIEPNWKEALAPEFEKPYFTGLATFIRSEYLTKAVYPPARQVFRAFDLCPFDKVRIVIVGQDPYHGYHQANGLCFAVGEEIAHPPSLKNIFKEIQNDLGILPYNSGDLSRWANQGVLMLNAVLTVLANSPTSHKGKGWEQFTDSVIRTLSSQKKHIVYMLWGKYAQEKGLAINRDDNLVLESGHPSPYSAHLFFGNNHFSKCNAYLKAHGYNEIDWR